MTHPARRNTTKMHKYLSGLVFVYALAVSTICTADAYEKQRELFNQAETAFKAGDTSRFNQLKQQLIDYPLYPYLEYWPLRRKLSKAKPDEVENFLQKYDAQPVGWRLRSAWLQRLGKRKDWDNYLRFYDSQNSVTLQCYDVRARLAKGDRQQALKDALDLWLVGHSQPDACDPAFKQLYASKLLNSELVWKRIRLAFTEQKPSLAVYLSKRLSNQDQQWVKRWRYAHQRPTAAIAKDWAREDTPLVREILTHAIRRLARHKPAQAWKHWQKLASDHAFSAEQQAAAIHQIALYGALRKEPDASIWLAAVPRGFANEKIRHWRVRVALTDRDWGAALKWIDELKPSEKNDDIWRYWRAYALDASGASVDAQRFYAQLSDSRSYYGFLAADRLQRPYPMEHTRIPHEKEQMEQIEQLPGILRARQLYLSGMQLDARREWYYATLKLPREKLKLAAVVAHRWGWHDRAILTASRAHYWSDLVLRFPLPHRDSIFHYADQRDLDPALIYGVIRQESAFMEDARSPVGALGLMQLMPNTGKQTARALKIRYRGNASLLKSDQNIRLGSAYLGKQLERYNGSPVLAAAAYNAGPHRVSRWLPKDKSEPANLWIERIPYTETRRYVRRVLAYATIFDWRLERPVTRLEKRMPIVKPKY